MLKNAEFLEILLNGPVNSSAFKALYWQKNGLVLRQRFTQHLAPETILLPSQTPKAVALLC